MAIANSDGSIILTTKIDTGGVSKALDIIKNKFSALKDQRATIASITEAIKMQKERLQELNKEYAQRVASGQAGTSELKEEIELETKALKELEAAATTLGKKSTKSFDDMSNGLKKFGKRVAGIVKSALIFSVLYRVMQSVVKLFNNILMSDEEFRQDWEELKAAFYTAAYPIINLIVPAIKWIVQQVRDWAVSIGKVAAALQGVSYSELVDQAKASKEAADNYADMEKSSKKTADNVKKQFASFDNIEVLSSGDENEDKTNYFDKLKEYDTSGEKNMLADIMRTIAGALLAVGIILLFHGQIPWGIGLMVEGAAIFAASEASKYDYNEIIQMLTTIMGVAGGALLALGIILLWAGGVVGKGVAIGMIIAGGALIVSSVATQAAFAPDDIAAWLSLIMGIAGGALLALGVILCMAGSVPVGVGMIIAGSIGLVSAVALNFNAVTDQIKGWVAVIMAIAGGALLVLGIILCATGAALPLGIALIMAGAVALVTPIALNWNAIVDWVKGAWNAVKSFWNANIAPIFTAKFWLDLAKNCGNGLIGGFEAAINGIIGMFEKMINWIVDGLNKISFDVPDWVPFIGGQKFGFNIPRANLGRLSIPRLAQGTVVPPNKEFMAILGDNKKEHEIVSPLSTIEQAVANVLSRQGGTTKEEHYYLNESELMRVVYKLFEGGKHLNGTSLEDGGY